jgi:hypothetical protein
LAPQKLEGLAVKGIFPFLCLGFPFCAGPLDSLLVLGSGDVLQVFLPWCEDFNVRAIRIVAKGKSEPVGSLKRHIRLGKPSCEAVSKGSCILPSSVPAKNFGQQAEGLSHVAGELCLVTLFGHVSGGPERVCVLVDIGSTPV